MRPAAALGLGAAGLLVTSLAWGAAAPAHAAEAEVDLRTARSFAILAGQAVTNTGASLITGDLGVHPGTAVSGFPPGLVVGGTQHVNDAVALQAQNDLTTAYNDAAGRSTTVDVTGTDLGGRTFTSGVYEHTSGMQLTGTVILDAQGDPNAVFIFKAGSTLITASNSTVALINGASPCNVFWKVGSSATLGTNTDFAGTVMALTSATLDTGADVQGRILARNGTVSLDNNRVTAPNCAARPTSPTTTAVTSSAPAGVASTTPVVKPTSDGKRGGSPNRPSAGTTKDGGAGTGGTAGSGGSGTSGGPAQSGSAGSGASTADTADTSTATIPLGHPETGYAGPVRPLGPLMLLALAIVAGVGAIGAGARAIRVPHKH